MEIKILGPLVAKTSEGISFVPSARKPRKVLALLLLNANHIVSVGAITKELWDEEPPPSVLTTLQTYILQVRRLLTEATSLTPAAISREVLVTTKGGYQLNIETIQFDLHAYREFDEKGRRALATGNSAAASHYLRSALDQWRGPALIDVQAGRLLELDVMRLTEARLATLERRVEADLRIGLHREVLPELTALVAEHTYHEDFHAQLMIALHRSGRRVQALECYHRLRSNLVEHLGLEPSTAVQELHQTILVSDSRLDAPDNVVMGRRLAAS